MVIAISRKYEYDTMRQVFEGLGMKVLRSITDVFDFEQVLLVIRDYSHPLLQKEREEKI